MPKHTQPCSHAQKSIPDCGSTQLAVTAPWSSKDVFSHCCILQNRNYKWLRGILSSWCINNHVNPVIECWLSSYLQVSVINDNSKHLRMYCFSHILAYFLSMHSKKWDYWIKGYEYFTGSWYTLPNCFPNRNNQHTMPLATLRMCQTQYTLGIGYWLAG